MSFLDESGKDHRVAEEFDRQASRYDRSLTVRRYQSRTQALVLDRLSIRPGMRVLDLGCGTGTAALEIASRLNGTGKVVGIDVSSKMLEQAQNKLSESGHSTVEFVLSSAHDLDYEATFDVVYSTNAYHHFADKTDIFRRVWQSLKSSGCFWVQDFCSDFLLMRGLDLLGKLGERAHVGTTTSHHLKALYESTGFADAEVTSLKLNWLWGIMIGKGVKPQPED
jgi:ubiquinone/menaquinone biosynthesis C-methylase UbiE